MFFYIDFLYINVQHLTWPALCEQIYRRLFHESKAQSSTLCSKVGAVHLNSWRRTPQVCFERAIWKRMSEWQCKCCYKNLKKGDICTPLFLSKQEKIQPRTVWIQAWTLSDLTNEVKLSKKMWVCCFMHLCPRLLFLLIPRVIVLVRGAVNDLCIPPVFKLASVSHSPVSCHILWDTG